MKIKICADGIPVNVDGINGMSCKTIELDMPGTLSDEQIEKIKRDSELLIDQFQNNSEKINTALSHAQSGDIKSAKNILIDIGFDEQAFRDQGGGLLLQGIVLIGILLIAQEAH